jgi:hypothetical protein
MKEVLLMPSPKGIRYPLRDEEVKLIRERMHDLGVDQKWLGDRVGLTSGTISRIVRGEIYGTTALPQIFESLGVDYYEFLRTHPDRDHATFRTPTGTADERIPILGYIGAGALYYPDPAVGAWGAVSWIKAPPSGFSELSALEVRGRELLPAYGPGDMVFFDNSSEPVTGHEPIDSDYIIRLTNEHTLLGTIQGDAVKPKAKSGSTIRLSDVLWVTQVLWVMRARSKPVSPDERHTEAREGIRSKDMSKTR